MTRSWKTIKRCCTCPSLRRSRTPRRTRSALLLTPRVRTPRQTTAPHTAAPGTKNNGSRQQMEGHPRRRSAPPPSSCRASRATVSIDPLLLLATSSRVWPLCLCFSQRFIRYWAWRATVSRRRRRRGDPRDLKVKTKTLRSDPKSAGTEQRGWGRQVRPPLRPLTHGCGAAWAQLWLAASTSCLPSCPCCSDPCAANTITHVCAIECFRSIPTVTDPIIPMMQHCVDVLKLA